MDASPLPPRVRRPRYAGKHPRAFDQKYKEREPDRYPETVAKVMASGKTPAGTHRPIMVQEVLEVLAPRPGQTFVDATLGYGGHAEALLGQLLPGGRLIGLDADPVELPKTEQRLRARGFDATQFVAVRCNYAGLPDALEKIGVNGVDGILADLGVSSMQLDDPARGFSFKVDGPLDMRLNPRRGLSAAELLARFSAGKLQAVLEEYADESRAAFLAPHLAGRPFATTTQLSAAIRSLLAGAAEAEVASTVRRVFQALRIAVNDEFSSLDTFLKRAPSCLRHGGSLAILTFHSGEDRRVKKAFLEGRRAGRFNALADTPIRASADEQFANPRSAPAKLRWARSAP